MPVRRHARPTLLDTVLLRRGDWLASGAALGERDASTARFQTFAMPFACVFLASLVVEGTGALWARVVMAVIVLGCVGMWPYYATLVRGHARRDSIDARGATPVELDGLGRHADRIRLFAVVFLVLMAPGWLGQLLGWLFPTH